MDQILSVCDFDNLMYLKNNVTYFYHYSLIIKWSGRGERIDVQVGELSLSSDEYD